MRFDPRSQNSASVSGSLVKLNPDLLGHLAPRREPGKTGAGHDLEMDLHAEIMAWCDGQWPRWKYIRARSDQRSTIQAGAQDFTVFGPGGRCLLVECKSRTGKPSEDQLCWAAEMRQLGWTVHVVRTLEEFVALANAAGEPLPPTAIADDKKNV